MEAVARDPAPELDPGVAPRRATGLRPEAAQHAAVEAPNELLESGPRQAVEAAVALDVDPVRPGSATGFDPGQEML